MVIRIVKRLRGWSLQWIDEDGREHDYFSANPQVIIEKHMELQNDNKTVD